MKIKNQKEYEKIIDFMDALIDQVGNDQTHSLAPLLEFLGELLLDWEEV